MSSPTRRRRIATTFAAAVGLAAAVLPATASAVETSNGCRNSVTANNSQINVDTLGSAPATVAPGGTITLTGLSQTANVPGAIFVAGYNLGLLQVGENNIPAKVFTDIEGTNTVEGVKTTSIEDVLISTTITDPDGPGGVEATATDGTFTVNYDDLSFTAGPSGVAEFRQDTQTPLAPSPAGSEVGSLVIRATIGGFLPVRFACSPGTVTGPDPGVYTPIDPATTFASTNIQAVVASIVSGSGSTNPVSGPSNSFSIDAPDLTSGTLSFTHPDKSFNGTIQCVKVVGNAATIVSKDLSTGRVNRAMMQDNGAVGDKLINTMVDPAKVKQKVIDQYSVCIDPDTTALAAANAITGDITIAVP